MTAQIPTTVSEVVTAATKAVTYYPTFWFGLAVGMPFLWIGYRLAMHAIDSKADLTATGLMIGAIGGTCGGLMTIFIVRAKAADAAKE